MKKQPEKKVIRSIRIGNTLREQMLKQAMELYKIKNPPPKSKGDASDEAGMALWNVVYDKVIIDAPEDMIQTSSYISASFVGKFERFVLKKQVPSVSESSSPTPLKVFDKLPAFYKQYLHDIEKYDEWYKKRDIFRDELRSIFYSVSTSRQLVDIWPEAESLLPASVCQTTPVCNLPALKTDNLNKMLGLNK